MDYEKKHGEMAKDEIVEANSGMVPEKAKKDRTESDDNLSQNTFVTTNPISTPLGISVSVFLFFSLFTSTTYQRQWNAPIPNKTISDKFS